jgi:hypothetical protein
MHNLEMDICRTAKMDLIKLPSTRMLQLLAILGAKEDEW